MNTAENLLERARCADCGHGYLEHYNAREGSRKGKSPCHKHGKHDSRCQCRDYRAPEAQAK